MFGTFSSMALRMAMLAGLCAVLVQTEISQQFFGWIAMKLCTNMHCPQRMNPNDSGDHLTCPPAPLTD